MSRSMVIDEIDLEIVRHLWDGRKPYADIASKLGVTTNTVRNRVNKMIEASVLEIIGLIEPKAIAGHYAAFVTFKVDPAKVAKALEQICEIKGVNGVACVSGGFDIVADVLFNEEYTHEKFLFEELPKVEGLKSIETHFVVKSINWQTRYVL
ncbi:MAG: Lrp/AsnC family transcriptional regulator [Desulfobacterales bacterium]|nr:Lrp/AsnC family transcriptional regulator [Desulfobacterales bacterium]